MNAPVDVMVSPQNLDRLYHALDGRGIEHSVLIDDVQRLAESIKTADPGKMMSWDVYHPLEDMYEYMDYLEETFPESVSTEVIGQSYEGRDMRVIKICGGGECGKKPGMYIEGGIHAREWISPAVVTYMMRELTENITGQQELVDELDWYIVPSVNPDGYVYTWSDDRLWRKTRRGFH